MAIPKFYEFMKPLLKELEDGEIHTLKSVKLSMIQKFNLSDEDAAELLPSGRQTKFMNRLSWAGTYLKKAGLIAGPARGTFQITKEGLSVLSKDPEIIDVEFLNNYKSFRDFQSSENNNYGASNSDNDVFETPDDTFEDAFKRINDNLSDELLSEIIKLSPIAFERLVMDLLQCMGYGTFENSCQSTPVTGDEGIDGIIMEDKFGFNVIYIQAKKWDTDSSVGRPAVQSFVGAISGKGGSGLFVTTAKFSAPAIKYANEQHVILIDGKRLTQLMIEHNFGVSTQKTFEIKSLDMDLFNGYDE